MAFTSRYLSHRVSRPGAGWRTRGLARGALMALHFAALRVMMFATETARQATHVRAGLGSAQLHLSCGGAPAGAGGCVFAGLIALILSGCRSSSMRALDDDRLLRHPDHGFRHGRLPAVDIAGPGPQRSSSSRACRAGARADLLDRSVPRRGSLAALGAVVCGVAITGLSLAEPGEPSERSRAAITSPTSSVRARSRPPIVDARLVRLRHHASDQLRSAANETCQPGRKPPHIIMVLDEASFDVTRRAGRQGAAGLWRHFKSFDGKARSLLVEGAGGPTWYTEYNVLTGLSARSYGRLSY